jgi:hypothetical protein
LGLFVCFVPPLIARVLFVSLRALCGAPLIVFISRDEGEGGELWVPSCCAFDSPSYESAHLCWSILGGAVAGVQWKGPKPALEVG